MSLIGPAQWTALEDLVNEHRELTGFTPAVAASKHETRLVCALHGGGRTVSFTLDASGHPLEKVA